MKVKLKGKYVIYCDNDNHRLLEDGEVVYENDTIIYVGKGYDGQVDEVMDVGESIISPGFIDLDALGDIDHDAIHVEQPATKSKNLLWSQEYVEAGPQEFFTEEEEAFKSLYAYSQLILNGVTTAMPITSVFYKKWAETYEELEAAVHNAGKLGLRVYLGPSYQYGIREVTPEGDTRVTFKIEQGEAGLQRAVDFVKKYDNAYDGLVKGMLAPERIETQTEESLIQTKKYSEELNCLIRLHAAQGAFEYNEIKRLYNKTPIRYLYDIGFLDKTTAIPHVCCTAESMGDLEKYGSDLELIKETGATVIHCPLVIGRHGEAINSFARYREKGINMAMGTDTFPPDFFQNIRTATILSRLLSKKVEGSTYADLFRAATIGGANFLGREDLGRIKPGAKADMIVVDLSQFHIGNIDDPFRTMCLTASGSDIKMSIINGRVVMKDRQIPGINLEELKEKGQKYYNKLKQSYVVRDYQQLGEEKLFTPALQEYK
ncbi:chlorohydrolase family protein [Bacillus ndiopicus]|uniref:chlorohydrolase family protein n=1 Tax=Bacillus ndiopicus TaxID=1347368 RepID=UPI0005AA3F14|nr:chlorohydrolase family protein [Bacillus ndiopicus]